MEAPLTRAQQMRSLVPFVTVTLIWSSTWLVIRDQLGVVPPSWSITYRFVIAAAAMFAYAAITRAPLWLTRRQLAFAAILGGAQFALNFNLVYRAELYITSGLVALVFALLIVPNALLARVFLKQSVSARFLAGAAIAIAGIILLFAHEYRASVVDPASVVLGIGFTLCALLCASIANVMQAAPAARGVSMVTMLAWAMACAAVADGLWAWFTTGPPVMDWRPGYVAGVLYLGLIGSTLAFPLYFGVIRAIGPARAAWSGVLVPIIAMGLSTLFEDYRWSLQAVAGCALALLGLVVALRARSPAR